MSSICGFCIYVIKTVHKRINGFDESVVLAEDHDYARRAARICGFGVLKCYPIIVSVRRFDRDGRLNVAVKYLLCEAFMIVKGPVRSDIFKYRFGYAKNRIKARHPAAFSIKEKPEVHG